MAPLIPLGPFELIERIGRGGMAEVWRARHAASGTPVAIKLVTSRRALEPRFLEAFLVEVEAAARLLHPGIITVLDHGITGMETERASAGQLRSGSPYLAMELATGGALDRVRLPLGWPELVEVLLALLDALAHAHARGVVHRDLKPANVLLAGPTDLRPGPKLTDFGIAHALDRGAKPGTWEASSGTPHFMAPEQFSAEWRDYGPWTDLYALGCLAFLLASGRLPFEAESPMQLAWAHAQLSLPRLDPSLRLPEDFQRWVARLTEKAPQDRFQRAADAGWALLAIAEANRPRSPPEEREPTETPAAGEERTTEIDGPELLEARAAAWALADRLGRTGPTSPARIDQDAATTARRETPAELPRWADPPPADLATTRRDDPAEAGEAQARPRDQAVTRRAELPVAARPDSSLELSDGQVLAVEPASGAEPTPWPQDQGSAAALRAWRQNPTLPWVDAPGFGAGLAAPEASPTGALSPYPRRVPPLPPTWRRAARAVAPLSLLGAGLGLYGLRATPLVGRERERDRLWRALAGVREERRARAVLIQGTVGVGKSRLAQWIAERADEVGAALVLRASHGPGLDAMDGVRAMVDRALSTTGLGREEVEARLVARGFPREEAGAIASVLRPGEREERAPSGAGGERLLVLGRLIRRLAAERPVILCLDDLQWGREALALAQHLLGDQERQPAPLLFLCTVREDALSEGSRVAEQVTRFCRNPRVELLVLAPLTPEEQGELVRALLVLDDRLQRSVVERTGGNPLFAVELVGDWVHRGVLRAGPQGFQLPPGQDAALPDDIHQLWQRRLASLLPLDDAGARSALEVGAALGQRFQVAEWTLACTAAGQVARPELLTALRRGRLAREQDGVVELAHVMFRESVLRAAAEAGRLPAAHRGCAAMLGEHMRGQPFVTERIAAHLIAAGDLQPAAPLLLEAARERFHTADLEQARALLERRDDLLAELSTAEDDEVWGHGWVLRARLALVEGEFERAEEWAQHAERYARRWGWRLVLATAVLELGRAAYERGRLERAIELFLQGADLARWNKDLAELARAELGVADALYRRGDLERAARRYGSALSRFEVTRDTEGMADALLGLGYIELWRGRLVQAAHLFDRYSTLVDGTGSRRRQARAANALGELARHQGHQEEAEFHYRRALALDEAIGAHSIWVERLNLGLLLYERGSVDEAGALLEEVAAGSDPGQPTRVATTACALLPIYASRGRWAELDLALARLEAALEASGLRDGDVAGALEEAGRRAAARGEARRAGALCRLAAEQWRALGRHDRVDAVANLAARLPSTPGG